MRREKKHHFALTHLTDIFERIVRIEIEIVEEKKHAVNTLNMRRKKKLKTRTTKIE